MKNKLERIKEELQATADYIAQLEIELGEISLEKDTFKTSALEKKIAKEYAYYNGLKYALEIIEN